MSQIVGYAIIAIIVLIYLGHIRLPGNFRLEDRYNPNHARFRTAGRNARQQQLASDRETRRRREEEELVVLENYEGDSMGGVGEEGEFVEHPELARKVKDERALRVAAAEARMKREKINGQTARRGLAETKAKKGMSHALKQASAENVGWRNADAMREIRSYN
ncbi:hypothetical protein FKW77_006509 [Venturia effusa]|uniref:Uncharacterized protein n=1 Tax=Venturia effusa TaxID=50376 RepID=A0A517LHD2_9PEZI|nr:hypothetical protein FKW77_006509 [Venturia effusa]